PFSRLNLAAMASFSSGVPSTSVYLVLPSRMALMAASLMLSGVSKSGWPADRPITFLPSATRARALASTARVADGLTRFRAEDSRDIDDSVSSARAGLARVATRRHPRGRDFVGEGSFAAPAWPPGIRSLVRKGAFGYIAAM